MLCFGDHLTVMFLHFYRFWGGVPTMPFDTWCISIMLSLPSALYAYTTFIMHAYISIFHTLELVDNMPQDNIALLNWGCS